MAVKYASGTGTITKPKVSYTPPAGNYDGPGQSARPRVSYATRPRSKPAPKAPPKKNKPTPQNTPANPYLNYLLGSRAPGALGFGNDRGHDEAARLRAEAKAKQANPNNRVVGNPNTYYAFNDPNDPNSAFRGVGDNIRENANRYQLRVDSAGLSNKMKEYMNRYPAVFNSRPDEQLTPEMQAYMNLVGRTNTSGSDSIDPYGGLQTSYQRDFNQMLNQLSSSAGGFGAPFAYADTGDGGGGRIDDGGGDYSAPAKTPVSRDDGGGGRSYYGGGGGFGGFGGAKANDWITRLLEGTYWKINRGS